MRKHLLTLCVLLSSATISAQSDFVRGGDVSWLTEMESQNVKFYDMFGQEQECMSLLKDLGMQAVRFRVWVNPENGWNGKADVVAKAKRAAELGLRIMIDFHYSNSWADPGQQNKPKEWEDLSMELLCDSVAGHTKDVLQAIKDEGITVEWVQIGNETPDGMLFPEGQISQDGGAGFTRLYMAGHDAAKAVYPDIKTMIHVDQGDVQGRFTYVFDSVKNNGGTWDIIGMSLYPGQDWATAVEACADNMEFLKDRYGTPCMLCETGYARDTDAATNYLKQLKLSLLGLSAETCQGVFYWEPEDYNGWNGGYSLGAFSNTGKPSKALGTLYNENVAYLAAYMKGSDEKNLYYALCEDKFLFNEMNGGQPITSAHYDDGLLRDPMVLRTDGGFNLVATVSWTNRPFTMWDSDDLVTWDNERLIDVAPQNATKTWAPELFYDEATATYMAYWTSDINNDWNTASIYYATTKDLTNWSEPAILHKDDVGILDANLTLMNGTYRLIYRKEGVWMVTSDNMTGPYSNPVQVTTDNVEGPFLFPLLDQSGYGIVWDYYANSAGFGLSTTTDFTTWTKLTNSQSPYYNDNVSFPADIRHGSITGITYEEMMRLKEAYGVTEENPTGTATNLDMENGTTGWTMESDEQAYTFRTISVYAETDCMDGNALEVWNTAGTLYNRTISQTIKDIPDGHYKITAGVMGIDQAHTAAADISGTFELFANSSSTVVTVDPNPSDGNVNLSQARLYTIDDAVVDDGTLIVGIRQTNSSANWIMFDNVTFTKTEESSGVQAIRGDNFQGDGSLYSIGGMRVTEQSARAKKGIYVRNGKKIIF